MEGSRGRGLRRRLLAPGRQRPLAEEGLARSAEADAGLALEHQEIERRRKVAAAQAGKQRVHLAAMVGLVIEEVVDRGRERLGDRLRVDDGPVGELAPQLRMVEPSLVARAALGVSAPRAE